jgi:hypothetical protein
LRAVLVFARPQFCTRRFSSFGCPSHDHDDPIVTVAAANPMIGQLDRHHDSETAFTFKSDASPKAWDLEVPPAAVPRLSHGLWPGLHVAAYHGVLWPVARGRGLSSPSGDGPSRLGSPGKRPGRGTMQEQCRNNAETMQEECRKDAGRMQERCRKDAGRMKVRVPDSDGAGPGASGWALASDRAQPQPAVAAASTCGA